MKYSAILLAFLLIAPTIRAGDKIDFVHDIAPILKARCTECHTNGKYKGSVSFDTREDFLKSKTGKSELIKRITSNDPEVRMPPKGKPLDAKEIALLKKWVAADFPWEP